MAKPDTIISPRLCRSLALASALILAFGSAATADPAWDKAAIDRVNVAKG